MKEINDFQKIQFELMRKSSFNNFDGNFVVDELIEYRDLWDVCVMTRLSELIQLRDIQHGYWNVDTLFIKCSNATAGEMFEIAQNILGADEVDFLRNDEACSLIGSYPFDGKIIRVWWD